MNDDNRATSSGTGPPRRTSNDPWNDHVQHHARAPRLQVRPENPQPEYHAEERPQGRRRRVFDALDKRYRPTLRELATRMNFSDEDAEDVVQETLLGLFLGGEMFSDTPEDFIGGLAVNSVLACIRAKQGRARLRSALARESVSNRAERNGRGAFWLRAIANKSSAHRSPALAVSLEPPELGRCGSCTRGRGAYIFGDSEGVVLCRECRTPLFYCDLGGEG